MTRPAPQQHHRPRPGLRGRVLAACVAAAACALVAAGCSGSRGPAPGNTPVTGGTAVLAESPSTPPTYIFPYMSSAVISNVNLFDFQYLMYRPLYWFGTGGQPTLNASLSLASPPTFNGTQVTISLKHYMWSNGTPVTATDVMFWLNMEKARPADYGAYTDFPADVSNITVVSPTELTMTMATDKAYSPTWFLYNQLSQITPMPAAWDRTATGPSDCAAKVSDCAAVYDYLNDQAKDLSSYVGSPLWSVVDGPWKLSAFDADGHVSFVPNKAYSGPVKPRLAMFSEVPFTTDSAEYDVLRSPSSSTKIDVGYLPEQAAPPKPAGAAVGANPVPGYALVPWQDWGINFFVVNYQSTTGNGPIIRQLYFRQVLEDLMNQAAVVRGPLRGYGTETVGPVGNTPVTSWLSPQGKAGNPFPYDAGPGEIAADQPRLDGGPGRGVHLRQPGPVRAGDQEGPGAELHPAVRVRDRVDRRGDDRAAVQRRGGRDPAEPGAQAVRAGHLGSRGELRDHQGPVQLGHGELGRWLVVLPGLPAHRRAAVLERGGRERGRVQRPQERRDDQPDAHQQQPAGLLQLAGLPGGPAAGDLAAGG